MHDVWQLPTEESYNVCDFDALGARKVSDASTSSIFEFSCDQVGTYYFACSVDDACSSGKQKVRIYVSDPAQTIELRARGGVSLEEFNRNYTLLFAGYFLNKQDIAHANLKDALVSAHSLLEHSPKSCSDWIPASWNSNQSCQAFVYTDLGFIARAGPDADFDTSERYYRRALAISPGMCGATSYLAELRVQQNMKTEADEQYVKACKACGEYSLDFHDLIWAYEQRGWALPSCPGTVEFSQTVQFTNFDDIGDTSTLQSKMQSAVATATATSATNLKVVLSEIKVKVSYSNIPDDVTDVQIIEAIAKANDVSTEMVKVVISDARRLRNLRSLAGARSLAKTVDAEILIDTTSGVDMVEKAKKVQTASQNTSSLATAISEASGGSVEVSPSSLKVAQVPTLSVVFGVVAKGSSDVEFSSDGVKDTVGANVGGTVMAVVVVTTTSTSTTTTTTTTSTTTSTTRTTTTSTTSTMAITSSHEEHHETFGDDGVPSAPETTTTTRGMYKGDITVNEELDVDYQGPGDDELTGGACSLFGRIGPHLMLGLALACN